LKKRRLWAELFVTFQYVKGLIGKTDGERIFTSVCSDRTRSNSFKVKETRSRLDIRKKLFTLRVVRHWNRLSRLGVDASLLEVFKVRLGEALTDLMD